MKVVTHGIGMESVTDSLFYTIEKSIKLYRQFSQRTINENGYSITIDQWLVLKLVQDNDDITLVALSDILFKDIASISRIIQLLVKNNYLICTIHPGDKRRARIRITKKGCNIIQLLIPIIQGNRRKAINGLTSVEINQLHQTLNKIIDHCSE